MKFNNLNIPPDFFVFKFKKLKLEGLADGGNDLRNVVISTAYKQTCFSSVLIIFNIFILAYISIVIKAAYQ
jgi:hypothetical protein